MATTTAIPRRRPSLGARRRRFVLERCVEEPDGFGGVLRRYVAGPMLWGAITPVGMVARELGGREDERATHRVTLRARADLSPLMRLAAGPRRFVIRTVTDPDDRGRDLVCHSNIPGCSGPSPSTCQTSDLLGGRVPKDPLEFHNIPHIMWYGTWDRRCPNQANTQRRS